MDNNKCWSLTDKGKNCKQKAIEGKNFCRTHIDNPKRSTDIQVVAETNANIQQLLIEEPLRKIAMSNPDMDILLLIHGYADLVDISKRVLNNELNTAQGRVAMEGYKIIFDSMDNPKLRRSPREAEKAGKALKAFAEMVINNPEGEV